MKTKDWVLLLVVGYWVGIAVYIAQQEDPGKRAMVFFKMLTAYGLVVAGFYLIFFVIVPLDFLPAQIIGAALVIWAGRKVGTLLGIDKT